jgi:hypothetical protein
MLQINFLVRSYSVTRTLSDRVALPLNEVENRVLELTRDRCGDSLVKYSATEGLLLVGRTGRTTIEAFKHPLQHTIGGVPIDMREGGRQQLLDYVKWDRYRNLDSSQVRVPFVVLGGL